jgi:hypothetical protein
MLFGNYLFIFCIITSFYERFSRIMPEHSPKPRAKSYTSELVMELERFEVGAYTVSDRLIAGITDFLGDGVQPKVY